MRCHNSFYFSYDTDNLYVSHAIDILNFLPTESLFSIYDLQILFFKILRMDLNRPAKKATR